MKITKEEKHVYKYLDIINKIFGKTSARTTLIGMNNKLYFDTYGYAGVIVTKDDEEHFSEYDFKRYYNYDLKQLPNRDYVLDESKRDEEDITGVNLCCIEEIEKMTNNSTWTVEIKKDDEYKISKIAFSSNMWIRDEDGAYLKVLQDFDAYVGKEYIIIEHRFSDCYLHLILKKEIIYTKSIEKNSQMKIDAYMNEENVEELPEEFEDEDDPMA